MRVKYKSWAKPFIEENKDFISYDFELSDSKSFKSFLKRKNLNLEIGSGKGLFITEIAKKYADLNFLCIEKNTSMGGVCGKTILNSKLDNIYLVVGDMANVFEKIEDIKFDNIFLNHSDPWPKKRHEKRRLTYKSFLDSYKKILSKDGYLIIKSDNLDFFNYTVESLNTNNWEIVEITYDYKDDDAFDALTNYEISFRNKNVPIKRLKARYKED